jgi:hypothetical protein
MPLLGVPRQVSLPTSVAVCLILGKQAKERGIKRRAEDAQRWRRLQVRARAKAKAKGKAKARAAKAKAKAAASSAPVAGAGVPAAQAVQPPPPPPPVMRIPDRVRARRGDNTEVFGTSWTLAKVQLGAMLEWGCREPWQGSSFTIGIWRGMVGLVGPGLGSRLAGCRANLFYPGASGTLLIFGSGCFWCIQIVQLAFSLSLASIARRGSACW